MSKIFFTNIANIGLIAFGLLILNQSESIGSGKPPRQDQYDKQYTYRGGRLESKERREAWDFVNAELAAQDRASAQRNAGSTSSSRSTSTSTSTSSSSSSSSSRK